MILGLTGSMGMGKSTTAQMFRDMGVPVWDADATVHTLYAPGGAAVEPVGARFPTVRNGDRIDRAALRAEISADPDTVLKGLNEIVHPLVAQHRADWMHDRGGQLVVWDVPLLFETGGSDACDRIAVVTVDPETQRARILARGTMTAEEVDQILARQMPDADKRARADYIIETTTPEAAWARVATIVEELA